MAVTCTVTVMRPPLGIVTEPWIVVPLMVKVPVTAEPLTALPRLWALPNWLGKVSTKLALVSVEGPALLSTKLKLVVAPVATVLVLDSLATDRLTVGTTPITALTVVELVPTEVVNEPGAIVLVTVPPTELVTTTVMVQVDACGIKVPRGSVKEPVFGVAVAPRLQPLVMTDAGVALTRPVG